MRPLSMLDAAGPLERGKATSRLQHDQRSGVPPAGSLSGLDRPCVRLDDVRAAPPSPDQRDCPAELIGSRAQAAGQRVGGIGEPASSQRVAPRPRR